MADNVLGSLFGDIADAIRAKTGGTETMTPASFPAKIGEIETGGGMPEDDNYVYWRQEPFIPITLSSAVSTNSFTFNNAPHIALKNSETSNYEIWKFDGDSWSYVCDNPEEDAYIDSESFIEFENELHMLGGETTNHWKFDGNSWSLIATLPEKNNSRNNSFVLKGELYSTLGTLNKKLYKFDGDTWTLVTTLSAGPNKGRVVIEDKMYYMGSNTNMYCYADGEETAIYTLNSNVNYISQIFTDGKNIFSAASDPGYAIRKFVNGDFIELKPIGLYKAYTSSPFVYNGRFHLLCNTYSSKVYGMHVSCALE